MRTSIPPSQSPSADLYPATLSGLPDHQYHDRRRQQPEDRSEHLRASLQLLELLALPLARFQESYHPPDARPRDEVRHIEDGDVEHNRDDQPQVTHRKETVVDAAVEDEQGAGHRLRDQRDRRDKTR